MADLHRAPPDDEDPPEPPRLRALRRLVTLLTVSAILGVVVVASTLVVRLSRPLTPPPALEDVSARAVALPAGETALSATLGGGVIVVLTEDAAGARRLRLFDAADGAAGPVVAVTAAP